MKKKQALSLLKNGMLFASFGIACSIAGLLTNQNNDTFFLVFRVLLTTTLASLIILLIKYNERKKRA